MGLRTQTVVRSGQCHCVALIALVLAAASADGGREIDEASVVTESTDAEVLSSWQSDHCTDQSEQTEAALFLYIRLPHIPLEGSSTMDDHFLCARVDCRLLCVIVGRAPDPYARDSQKTRKRTVLQPLHRTPPFCGTGLPTRLTADMSSKARVKKTPMRRATIRISPGSTRRSAPAACSCSRAKAHTESTAWL